MNFRFAVRHALRESRSSWRRIGLYMGAITIGVAALVAINSFRHNVASAIQRESRNLLGADLELHSNSPFPDSVQAVLDSAINTGVAISYLTTMPSMVHSPLTDLSRLSQVRAIEGGFPYYGAIDTEPVNAWSRLQTDNVAVVDRAVIYQLGIDIGDTVQLGEAFFEIAGVITSSPGEVSFQSAIGPRVYIPAARLGATGLVQFGSLVRYQAYLLIEENQLVQDFLNYNNRTLRENNVRYDTVAERVGELTDYTENLSRFLGLIGLTALLLGGIGVASAIHVFVKEKLQTIAVLRCIGATQNTMFTSYLLQATAMGLLGAIVGVLIGVATQAVLPRLLQDFLPLEVTVSVDWLAVAAGITIGVWVAAVFALLPLLTVRNVPPLRALRRDADSETPSSGSRSKFAAFLAITISIFAISVWQAPTNMIGVAFAFAIVITTVALWVTARLLMLATKRYFPRRARYVFRQGVSNLFRPHNQTAAVVIALGFGAFLIATIYLVQRNLLEPFSIDTAAEAPNMFLFDIQADQREDVVQLLASHDFTPLQITALTPSRMRAINGRTVAELLTDSAGPHIPRWALTRRYRHTYREALTATEELVAGEWWSDEPSLSGVARISIEQDLAEEMRVGLGDRITWDIQGTPLETEITSIRRVDWARFELNFFVVFEPSALRDAPGTIIAFTRIEDPEDRAIFQRDLVRQFPNVSIADLSQLQDALRGIIDKITLGIRFMALFSIASGIIVLFGASATSRFHRVRESVLLKTLGATRRQIGQILLTEYAALGSLAGLTGILLATIAGWALVKFLFDLTFHLPGIPLTALWLTVVGITTSVGIANGRESVKKPPLAVIRELGE